MSEPSPGAARRPGLGDVRPYRALTDARNDQSGQGITKGPFIVTVNDMNDRPAFTTRWLGTS